MYFRYPSAGQRREKSSSSTGQRAAGGRKGREVSSARKNREADFATPRTKKSGGSRVFRSAGRKRGPRRTSSRARNAPTPRAKALGLASKSLARPLWYRGTGNFRKNSKSRKKFKVKISKKFYFRAKKRSYMPDFRSGRIFSGRLSAPIAEKRIVAFRRRSRDGRGTGSSFERTKPNPPLTSASRVIRRRKREFSGRRFFRRPIRGLSAANRGKRSPA